MNPLKKEYYTFEEWLSWDEDVRAELYDGALIMMAPPSRRHQEISGYIFYQIYTFLREKPCKVYNAPFGVRLNESEDTVLEPDIVVICDERKLDDKMCHGAPDLVVEILSPATARMDRGVKYRKYQQAGVREYWIVDPELNLLQTAVLSDGKYISSVYEENDIVPVSVLEGCEINLGEVFKED